ncbi:hypothetical protein [Actinoplanes subtropicus]|uniref:hypothetical protein n=1 Tax=Actinoplanes subtropicus TaxID=543632 RepID=UPI000AB627F2|nr:hypothetical protein [Actinoplanes subtropicus]
MASLCAAGLDAVLAQSVLQKFVAGFRGEEGTVECIAEIAATACPALTSHSV